MSKAGGWERRIAVVVATTLLAGVGMVMAAGGASAGCSPGTDAGDVNHNLYPTRVAVDNQPGPSDTEHDVVVCATSSAPAPVVSQETTVRLADADPATGGLQAGASTCGAAGCTGFGDTGFEAGPIGWTYWNPPLDGSGSWGTTVEMGSGVCLYANGSALPCQLGGTIAPTFSGGDIDPPPVHPAVDPVTRYAADTVHAANAYAEWCHSLFFQYYWADAATTCALALTGRFAVDPALFLVDYLT